MNDRDLYAERIAEYLDGGMNDGERLRFEDEARRDPALRKELEAARRIDALLRGAPVPPAPPKFVEQVADRLRNEAEVSQRPEEAAAATIFSAAPAERRWRFPARQLWQMAAAVAALAIGAAVWRGVDWQSLRQNRGEPRTHAAAETDMDALPPIADEDISLEAPSLGVMRLESAKSSLENAIESDRRALALGRELEEPPLSDRERSGRPAGESAPAQALLPAPESAATDALGTMAADQPANAHADAYGGYAPAEASERQPPALAAPTNAAEPQPVFIAEALETPSPPAAREGLDESAVAMLAFEPPPESAAAQAPLPEAPAATPAATPALLPETFLFVRPSPSALAAPATEDAALAKAEAASQPYAAAPPEPLPAAPSPEFAAASTPRAPLPYSYGEAARLSGGASLYSAPPAAGGREEFERQVAQRLDDLKQEYAPAPPAGAMSFAAGAPAGPASAPSAASFDPRPQAARTSPAAPASPPASAAPIAPGTPAGAPTGAEIGVIVFPYPGETMAAALGRGMEGVARALSAVGGAAQSFRSIRTGQGAEAREVSGDAPLRNADQLLRQLTGAGLNYRSALDGSALDTARAQRGRAGEGGASYFIRFTGAPPSAALAADPNARVAARFYVVVAGP